MIFKKYIVKVESLQWADFGTRIFNLLLFIVTRTGSQEQDARKSERTTTPKNGG